MMRRHWGRWMCGVALTGALALTGCQRTALPEAGLTPDELTVEDARLRLNRRGEWIAAVPQGQSMGRYAVVQANGTSRLFYATARGARTAELLPISPTSAGWVARAAEMDAPITFVDDPRTLQGVRGVGLLDANSESITWLGAQESPVPHAAVLMATQPHADLAIAEMVVSAGRVEGARFTPDPLAQTRPAGTPCFVVLDGAVREDDFVVGIAGGELPATSDEVGMTIRRVEVRAPSSPEAMVAPALQPLALKAEVDVLLLAGESMWTVIQAEPEDSTMAGGIAAALAEVPLQVETPEDALRTAHALRAARDGHPWRAFHLAMATKITVQGNAVAGKLRAMELLGAAGAAHWFVRGLTASAEVLQAPELVYLARAALIEGDAQRARTYASLAFDVFGQWSGNARDLGLARALTLLAMSQLAADEDPAKALDQIRRAIALYERAGDEVAMARAELFAASVAQQSGEAKVAMLDLKRARSRFYYANDIFSCAMTEMVLAQMYVEQEAYAQAAEAARYAYLRMKDLEHPVGLNRAEITQMVVQHHSPDAAVKTSEVRAAFEEAVAQRDGRGATSAAAALTMMQASTLPDTLTRYGVWLWRAQQRYAYDAVLPHYAAAFSTSCALGLGNQLAEIDAAMGRAVQVECRRVLRTFEAPVALVRVWLTQGWGALLTGQEDEASAMAEQLKQSLAPRWIDAHPQEAARVYYYRASVARRLEGTAEAKALEDAALASLDQLDASVRGLQMVRMAHELIAHGELPAARTLLVRGQDVAQANGQQEVALDAILTRLRTYRHVGVDAEEREQMLMGFREDGATLRGASEQTYKLMRALIFTHIAHHQFIAGEDVKAKDSLESAFLAVAPDARMDAITVRVEAAELAVLRSDLDDAGEFVAEVEELANGRGRALTASQRGERLRARADLVVARSALMRGEMERARTVAQGAMERLTDDASSEGVHLRADAIRILGSAASSRQEIAALREELQKMLTLLETSPGADLTGDPSMQRAVIEVVRAKAHLAMLAGDARAALDALDAIAVAGLSPRRDAALAGCERGVALVLVGEVDAGRAELAQCAQVATGWEAAQARLMRAVFEYDTVPGKRELLTTLLDTYRDSIYVRDVARLELMREVSTYEDVAAAEKRARRDLERASTQQAKAEAVEALADLLMAKGQLKSAHDLLEAHDQVFYNLEGDWPGRLVRLQGAYDEAILRPDEALRYLGRASAELPADTTESTRSRIALLRARAALMLGQYSAGAAHLNTAAAYAKDAGARALTTEIQALAKRFFLPMD